MHGSSRAGCGGENCGGGPVWEGEVGGLCVAGLDLVARVWSSCGVLFWGPARIVVAGSGSEVRPWVGHVMLVMVVLSLHLASRGDRGSVVDKLNVVG